MAPKYYPTVSNHDLIINATIRDDIVARLIRARDHLIRTGQEPTMRAIGHRAEVSLARVQRYWALVAPEDA